jgi:uncharacterized membrane protein YfcA
MILGRALLVSGVGATAGVCAAIVTTRTLAALLFEVKPSDAATIASVLAVLMMNALVASWIQRAAPRASILLVLCAGSDPRLASKPRNLTGPRIAQPRRARLAKRLLPVPV